VGIEIVKEQANDAHAVLNKLIQNEVSMFSKAAPKCAFKQGDILEFTSEWAKADIVNICATAFEAGFLKRLEKQLEGLKRGAVVLFTSHKMKSVCFNCIQTLQRRSTYGEVTINIYKRNKERKLVAHLLRGTIR